MDDNHQDHTIDIEPLSELDRYKFMALNAKRRALLLERENLLLNFMASNPQARYIAAQLQDLEKRAGELSTAWCSARNLKPGDYAIDEETGKFVKVAQ